MRKLTLKLDDLQVESFTTAETERSRGTVEAHASCRCSAGGATCDPAANTCGDGDTCNVDTCCISCMGSCPCYPEYDGTNDSCDQFSCVWTCAINC